MKKLSLLFLLSTTIIACTSDPVTEEEIEDIYIPIEKEEVEIDYNIDTDTVYIWMKENYDNYEEGNEVYQLAYHIKSHEAYWVKLYANSWLTDGSIESRDTLNISRRDLCWDNCSTRVKIEFILKTDSGSKADQLDKEFYTYKKEWIFISDRDYVPKITGTSVKDDYLKLHWEKYKGFDFKSYIIRHTNRMDTLVTLTDIDNTSAIDSSYIGLKKDYRLYTTTTKGDIYSKYTTSSNITNEPKVTVSEHIYGNVIEWEKPTFSKGISKYRIYEEYRYSDEINLIGEVDSNTLSYTHHSENLSSYKKFYVHPVARYLPSVLPEMDRNWGFYKPGVYESYDFFLPGLNKRIKHIASNSKGDIFVATWNQLHLMYDDYSTSAITHDNKGLQVFSCGCKYYLIAKDGIAKLYLTEDNSLVSAFTLNDITLDDPRFELRDIAVADNGIVAFAFDQIYTVDMINNKQLTTIRLNDFYYNNELKISADGKYVSFTDYYEVEKRSVTKLVEVTSNEIVPNSIELEERPTIFYDWINLDIYHYFKDGFIHTGSKLNASIKKLYIQDDILFSIDFYKREFLTVNIKAKEFRIYDLTSGSLKYTLNTSKDNLNGIHRDTDKYILCNNFIFGPYGWDSRLLKFK